MLAFVMALALCQDEPVVLRSEDVKNRIQEYVTRQRFYRDKLQRKLVKEVRYRNLVSANRIRRQLRDLAENPPGPWMTHCRIPYEVGRFGAAHGTFHVIQVLDNGDVLADARYSEQQFSGLGGTNPSSTLARKSQTVLLRNFGLKGPTSGLDIEPEVLVFVSGTFTYNTVLGGTTTVPVLTTFKAEDYYDDDFLVKLGLKKPPKRNRTTSDTKPDSDPEESAAAKLELAQRLIDSGKQDTGEEWLRKLIEDYPDTKAAGQARELLGED